MTAEADGAFSERDFYLQEFRGRTLGVACPAACLRDPAALAPVLHTLARNDTNVIVISSRRAPLAEIVGDRILPAATPRLETAIWRSLRVASRLGILLGGRLPFAAQCRELALRLGFFKLVWWQMPLAVGGVLIIISGPSVLIAWFKLRQRTLGPILDANGWAVNARARLNIPFGASLTAIPRLPKGAKQTTADPYAEKKSPWKTVMFIVLLVAAFIAWRLGWFGR